MIINNFQITEQPIGWLAESLANPLLRFFGRTPQSCVNWINTQPSVTDKTLEHSEANNHMHDQDVRIVSRKWLKNKYPNELVTDEFSILNGKARIDLAVVTDTLLMGVEIKSNTDTLARLAKQMKAYDMVFDYITLVVGNKHFDQAMKKIPDHWGVTKADIFEGSEGFVTLTPCREPKKNPNIKLEALMAMLWREDLDDIVTLHDIEVKGKKNCRTLSEAIVKQLSFESIKLLVVQTVKQHKLKRSWVNYY